MFREKDEENKRKIRNCAKIDYFIEILKYSNILLKK